MTEEQYDTDCPLLRKMLDLKKLKRYRSRERWEEVTCLYICPTERCIEDTEEIYSRKGITKEDWETYWNENRSRLEQTMPPCPQCQIYLPYKDVFLEVGQSVVSKLEEHEDEYKCWDCGCTIKK